MKTVSETPEFVSEIVRPAIWPPPQSPGNGSLYGFGGHKSMVALTGRKTLAALTANDDELLLVDGRLQEGTKEVTMTSPGRIYR